MRKQLITFAMIFFLAAGSCKEKNNVPVKKEVTKIALVSLDDISLSTQNYCSWDSAELANMYNVLASSGGYFKQYFIGDYGREQAGYELEIGQFDSMLANTDNGLQAARIVSKNRRDRALYRAHTQRQVSLLVRNCIRRKDQKSTCLYETLELAKMTLEMPNFSSLPYRRILLINSDMIADAPAGLGKTGRQVELDPSIRVMVIRPRLTKKELSQIFVNTPAIEIYSSIHSAVNNIIN